MKDPYVLAAASVFLGCTLADAQTSRPEATQPVARTAATATSAPFAVTITLTSADDNRLFAEAVQLYRAGRWSAAYGRFMPLADRGHVRAARIALAMHRDGASLYGVQWDATQEQVQSWQRHAGRKPAPDAFAANQ